MNTLFFAQNRTNYEAMNRYEFMFNNSGTFQGLYKNGEFLTNSAGAELNGYYKTMAEEVEQNKAVICVKMDSPEEIYYPTTTQIVRPGGDNIVIDAYYIKAIPLTSSIQTVARYLNCVTSSLPTLKSVTK